MGVQLGQTHAKQIQQLIQTYRELKHSLWYRLSSLNQSVRDPADYFDSETLQELEGLAEGAKVAKSDLISHNLRLYLEGCAGGLHFVVPDRVVPNNSHGNELLHGMNEDLSTALKLQHSLFRSIQVRRPAGKHPYVCFTLTGQLGTLSGINTEGLSVTTTTLLNVQGSHNSTEGLLITLLVRRILENCHDLNSATALVRSIHKQKQLAGNWSLCMTFGSEFSYLEHDGKTVRCLPHLSQIVSTNHQLLIDPQFENPSLKVPTHSINRRNRFLQLMSGESLDTTALELVKTALQDRFDLSQNAVQQASNMHTIKRVDHQISLVLQPSEKLLWVTPSAQQSDYLKIDLTKLLPEFNANSNSSSATTRDAEAKGSTTSTHSHSRFLTQTEFHQACLNVDPSENSQSKRVCSRFELKMVEKPLDTKPDEKQVPIGAAVILGENTRCLALFKQLKSKGIPVYTIPLEPGSIDVAINSLESIWKFNAIHHLFLMTEAVDLNQNQNFQLSETETDQIMQTYLVTQRWFQLLSDAKLFDQASLMAATSLGGDFGFGGHIQNAGGGAICGLVKGVRLELKMSHHVTSFRSCTIDCDSSCTAAQHANLLYQEWISANEEYEVGYLNGKRYVSRPVPINAVANAAFSVPENSNIIVTGGARGITAVVAHELGKRYRAKLHLIGSSPLPTISPEQRELSDAQKQSLKANIMREAREKGKHPIDAWKRFEKGIEIENTLQTLKAEGIETHYYACDITDETALNSVLNQIRTQSGPIHGIVHGAGFERASRFEKKQQQLVEQTFNVKVLGAKRLMTLTENDPLSFFLAFGSVSGRFGGVGQTDYCMANELLAKLVNAYRNSSSNIRATTFHWHAWDDVGMAVRPESKHIRQLLDLTFMPSTEGVQHLIDELEAGVPEGEILITERQTCLQHYPAFENISLERSESETLPLIDRVIEQSGSQSLIAEWQLDPRSDQFLTQHLFRERPLLPLVIGIEALAQVALQLQGINHYVQEIRDIQILNGMRFLTDKLQSAHLTAIDLGETVKSKLTCDFTNRKGKLLQKDRPYLQAEIVLSDRNFTQKLNATPPESSWYDVWYSEEDLVIYHGPIFRTVRQVSIDDEQGFGWTKLLAPSLEEIAGSRSLQGWTLPSALLDGCFYSCGIYLWHLLKGVVAIPAGIDRIQLGQLPQKGEECFVRMKFRDQVDNQGVFDLSLMKNDGTLILHVEGYRNLIVSRTPVDVH